MANRKFKTRAEMADDLKQTQLETTIRVWIGAAVTFAAVLMMIFSFVQAFEGFKLLGWL